MNNSNPTWRILPLTQRHFIYLANCSERMRIFTLLLFCGIAVSIHVQHFLSQLVGNPSPNTINEDKHIIHYSKVPIEELPISLEKYEGHIVVRVKFTDNPTLGDEFFVKIRNMGGIREIWSKSKHFIDLQIHESQIGLIKMVFPSLRYDIIIDDLPQKVFESYPSTSLSISESDVASDIFFKDYRPLSTIYAWLDILQQTFSDILEVKSIGKTFEGRDFKIIHLKTNNDHKANNDFKTNRKTIVITGGLHAREWISVSSVCYILFNLVNNYGTNKKETRILEELDFIFVPITNPDGYEYTWSDDRLWRKNRQPTYMPRCFGIDIDHSFDFQFQKSDDFPCGEEYSGEYPFQSQESQIWHDYLNETQKSLNIHGYIDLHSYAQDILYPYAYSCDHYPRDSENLMELAYGLSKAIRLKSGKHYDVLPACKDRDSDLLPALGSGTMLDYMYHNRANWAFQIKLRDSGSHGFLLPSKYIIPVGKEVYSSIKYFCTFILNTD